MIKRAMDIILSSIAIIALSPLLLPLVIILKLTGEGEIFYIQPRVGKDGQLFGLIKFATMLKDSPNLPGGTITAANDPRVLPLGRFLRKTKLNELPQLLNILKGEMSIVGPRPLTPDCFAAYPTEMQKEIKTMRPGLTGIGSIVFRDEEAITAGSNKTVYETYCEDVMPYKGSLEVWYKHHQSIWIDLLLILTTAWVIFFPNTRFYEKFFKKLPERPASLRVNLGVDQAELGQSSSLQS